MKKLNFFMRTSIALLNLQRKRNINLFRLTLLLVILKVSVSLYSQEKPLNFELKNVSLKEIFNAIEAQSEFTVFYKSEDINLDERFDYQSKGKLVTEILEEILANRNLSYEIKDKVIVIYSSDLSTSGKRLTGKVVDSGGNPVPGVNVVVKGTTSGVITGLDGHYSITLPKDTRTIVFSFVGMRTQEIAYVGQTFINITLENEVIGLVEVVAIGYGVRKKSSLTGAVASIKGRNVARIPTSNVTEALQGALAGVNVEALTYPGDNPTIRIRGVRSLKATNDPLVIVDGVPGTLVTLNSYDIASIEVLKDASATAIYGSRGANGVILVTTKKGSDSDYNVTYNYYTGINTPITMEMQSGNEYAQFRRDASRVARGWDNGPIDDEIVFIPEELEVIQNKDYTDWIDLLYRDGKIENHYISVSHNGEKTDLHLSINYNNEEGYYKTNEQTKLNINTNLEHTVNKKIKLGLITRFQNRNVDGFSSYGYQFTYMSPFGKAYNEDGSLNLDEVNPYNSSAYNVLANYEQGAYENTSKRTSAEMSSFLNIKFNNWINWRTNLGNELVFYNDSYFFSKDSYPQKGSKPKSGIRNGKKLAYNLSSVITFDKIFNDHHITADVVGEVSSSEYNDAGAYGENQPIDYVTYFKLESNAENIEIGSDYRKWTLASGLLRAQYDYQGKYLINVAVRADGSSRLAKDKKWSNFPSASAAWRISSERFLSEVNWLDDLKLRVSYGTVGNTSIPEYETLISLSQKSYIFGESDGFFAYLPTRVANKDLEWEVSKTINVGTDFRIFNGRLSTSLEFYKTNTTNLLMERALPVITGYSMITDNIGETQNKGIEVSLESYVVRSENLTYQINATWTANKEEIIDLYNHEDNRQNRWFIGEPLSVHYNYKFDGIYQLGEEEEAALYGLAPGDVKVVDFNQDTSILEEDDAIILGQQRPKWMASMRHFINYKNWDLSLMFNAKWGHMIHPETYSRLIWADGERWMFAHFDYWTPDNPTNKFPKADLGVAESRYIATMGYMKGDHIKLQEVSLGYSFDNLNLRIAKVSKIRIYGQLKNAFYIYKAAEENIYPEAFNLDLNVPRTIIFGTNINF